MKCIFEAAFKEFRENVSIVNGKFTLVSVFIKYKPFSAVDFGINSIYEFPE